MNTRKTLAAAGLLGVAMVVFCTPAVLALGIRLGNQNAFATARGNAFAATADNPSALFYNPAGISQLEDPELEAGAYWLFYDVDYDGDRGSSASMDDKLYVLPQLFYVHPLDNSPVTLGLGVYSPFGLASDWPDDGPFRSHATFNEVNYLTLTPVLSYRFSDEFSLAVGMTINYGDAQLSRGVALPYDEFQFDGDGFGAGFNAGLLWKPTARHAFGLTYRSDVGVDLEGSIRTRSRFPEIVPRTRFPASAYFRLPQQVVMGYSFRPSPDWDIGFDVEWTDWSSFQNSVVRTPGGRFVEELDWDASVVVSLGATRYLENGWYVSAGYWFAETTVPSSSFNPRVPDMDYHVGAIGFGRIWDQWRFGFMYQLGYGERTVSGAPVTPAGESVDGDYRYLSHALSFSLSYRF